MGISNKDLVNGIMFFIPAFCFLITMNLPSTEGFNINNFYVRLGACLFCFLIAGISGGIFLYKILRCKSNDCIS